MLESEKSLFSSQILPGSRRFLGKHSQWGVLRNGKEDGYSLRVGVPQGGGILVRVDNFSLLLIDLIGR